MTSRMNLVFAEDQNSQQAFTCSETILAITCSTLTIETLEQGVKYVQS